MNFKLYERERDYLEESEKEEERLLYLIIALSLSLSLTETEILKNLAPRKKLQGERDRVDEAEKIM